MKHKLLLSLLLLPLLAFAQNNDKKYSYLFNKLLDCPTKQDMIKTCESHSGTLINERPSNQKSPLLGGDSEGETMTSFSFPDGTIISFTVDSINSKKILPTIQVGTNINKKEFHKTLTENFGYKKQGNQFIKCQPFCKYKKIITFDNHKATKNLNFTASIEHSY